MILSFQVGNFRSIRDGALLSMEASADKDRPGELDVVRVPPGVSKEHKGVLSVAAIYGANGAGKSNVLGAMNLLFNILKWHYRDPSEGKKDNSGNPHPRLVPFKFNEETSSSPIEFELKFMHEKIMYIYYVSMTESKVFSESLSAFKMGRELIIFKRGHSVTPDSNTLYKSTGSEGQGYLFEKLSQEKDEISWSDLPSSGSEPWYWGPSFIGKSREGMALARRTANNAPFFSVGATFQHPQLQAAISVINNVCFINAVNHFDLNQVQLSLLRKHPEVFLSVSRMIKSADFGISELKIDDSNADDLKLLSAHVHENGSVVYLDVLKDESHGTRRFAQLAFSLTLYMMDGGTIVIDELQSGLHPLLARSLVKLFQDKKLNSYNSQLIFSSHDVTLFDPALLRRDQIYLVDKDLQGCSDLYSLSEFRDKPRIDVPLMKYYLSGRFNSIPDIENAFFDEFQQGLKAVRNAFYFDRD